MHVALVLVNGN